jgi:microcystin-dependent protein
LPHFLLHLLTVKLFIMDPMLGMIILWSSPRIPLGWLPCDGRQLTIQQYAALYAVIGIYFGGDGNTYFNLPDLRSRIPVGVGQGTNLSNYTLGQQGGTETVALNLAQLAAHNHIATASPSGLSGQVTLAATGALPASSSDGTTDTPGANAFPAKAPDYVSQGLSPNYIYGNPDGTTMPVNVTFQNPMPLTVTGNINVAVQNTGTNQGHPNIQPCLGMQYLIAYQGLFPDFN